MTVTPEGTEQPDVQALIRPDERTGVLYPRNLERYGAGWFEPAPAIAGVVDRYWHVHWQLEAGEVIEQRIIDTPAVTLTIEAGDVPARLVVTGVHRLAWMRPIAGRGSVFAIRLRPAGLAVLSDLRPEQIADATIPVTSELDSRLYTLLSEIAVEPDPESRARAADALIGGRVAERPIGTRLLLANAILQELTMRVRSRAGPDLAERFNVSERTIQRALRDTLGQGPKSLSRRIRLQEVALALAAGTHDDLAALAADLDYADEAHLITDFRRIAGITPAAYVRSLRALTQAAPAT